MDFQFSQPTSGLIEKKRGIPFKLSDSFFITVTQCLNVDSRENVIVLQTWTWTWRPWWLRWARTSPSNTCTWAATWPTWRPNTSPRSWKHWSLWSRYWALQTIAFQLHYSQHLISWDSRVTNKTKSQLKASLNIVMDANTGLSYFKSDSPQINPSLQQLSLHTQYILNCIYSDDWRIKPSL